MKAWDTVEESACIQCGYEGDCSNMTECKLKWVRPLNVSVVNEDFNDVFSEIFS